MYRERRESFAFKDVLIQLLFVALFIFILLWLFPSKGDLKRTVEPLYASIYRQNVATMSEAAKAYFTDLRLPQKVGDKVSISLSEMLDKKLLIPFVDSQGKQCDLTNSYVEVTKFEDEYTMKVKLSCSDNDDYIIVHMGCYTYCETAICEKQNEEFSVDNNIQKPKPKPIVKKYIYEYIKIVGSSYSEWGNWSDWSTNLIYENDLTDVETKTETTYNEKTKVVAYKNTTYQQPIYSTKQVCSNQETIYVGTGTYKYSEWVLQGTKVFYSTPVDTDTTRYVYVNGSSGDYDCGNCSSSTYASYQVYTRKKYEVKVAKNQCSSYTTKQEVTGYETKTKSEPIYGIVKVKNVTIYYRYRTRKVKNGSKTRKWSYYNNISFLTDGYQYTGKKDIYK